MELRGRLQVLLKITLSCLTHSSCVLLSMELISKMILWQNENRFAFELSWFNLFVVKGGVLEAGRRVGLRRCRLPGEGGRDQYTRAFVTHLLLFNSLTSHRKYLSLLYITSVRDGKEKQAVFESHLSLICSSCHLLPSVIAANSPSGFWSFFYSCFPPHRCSL